MHKSRVLLRTINNNLAQTSRRISAKPRDFTREINQATCQFFANSAKYTCVGLSDRAQRVYICHRARRKSYYAYRVSIYAYTIARVARSRRRQSPPSLIRRSVSSNESEWPLSPVPGSSAGLDRVSAVHPRPSIVDRSHAIVNRSFEPAASICGRRSDFQFCRESMPSGLLRWNWMHYVIIIWRWHHTK